MSLRKPRIQYTNPNTRMCNLKKRCNDCDVSCRYNQNKELANDPQ